jgi:hypothetical protein
MRYKCFNIMAKLPDAADSKSAGPSGCRGSANFHSFISCDVHMTLPLIPESGYWD